MKKLILTACISAMSVLAFSQTRIGLMVAPQFSTNRVDYNNATGGVSIDNDGSEIRYKFGLEFDFMLSDTYAFSSGIVYSPKRVGISGGGVSEEYKVQYIQLPATVKLFTSEIAPDLKAYFQLGFYGEIKVFSEPFDESYTAIEEFNFADISFTGGGGVEFGPGINTIIYGGIFYDRGLVNVIKEETVPGDLQARTSAIYLKLGLKF